MHFDVADLWYAHCTCDALNWLALANRYAFFLRPGNTIVNKQKNNRRDNPSFEVSRNPTFQSHICLCLSAREATGSSLSFVDTRRTLKRFCDVLWTRPQFCSFRKILGCCTFRAISGSKEQSSSILCRFQRLLFFNWPSIGHDNHLLSLSKLLPIAFLY